MFLKGALSQQIGFGRKSRKRFKKFIFKKMVLFCCLCVCVVTERNNKCNSRV